MMLFEVRKPFTCGERHDHKVETFEQRNMPAAGSLRVLEAAYAWVETLC